MCGTSGNVDARETEEECNYDHGLLREWHLKVVNKDCSQADKRDLDDNIKCGDKLPTSELQEH